MTSKKKVAVLISGYGGNLQALINACKKEDYPAEIVLVISSKAEAYGLERAEKANIPAFAIEHKNFKTREEFDQAIHNIITDYKAEVVCLAGFMRLLTPEFVNKWQNRMINIHPSLLPDFKGGRAVEDAIDAKVTKTGCTVHYVIPEMDSGPTIVQREVFISPYDDVKSLHEKIHKEEHIAYPEALKIVCGNI